MRGTKGGVHEGSVRVPLFVRWPGRVAAGRSIETLAAHIDVLPTLLDLAGVARPPGPRLDGRSLAAELLGASDGGHDRIIFTQYKGGGRPGPEPAAVRTARHRYVREEGGESLYDMHADPAQTKDISATSPLELTRLRDAYDRWFRDVASVVPAPPPVPVGHPAAPLVELPAPEARLAGGIRWHGRNGYANDWITAWTSTDATATWEIEVVRPGRAHASLLYSCPPDGIGTAFRVQVGSAAVQERIARAHDPRPSPAHDRVMRSEAVEKEWAVLDLGELALEQGVQTLTVRALEIPGRAAPELKAVRLLWRRANIASRRRRSSFRGFLRGANTRFLMSAVRHATRHKRGGQVRLVRMDAEAEGVEA